MLAASTRRSTSPGPGIGDGPLDELRPGPGPDLGQRPHRARADVDGRAHLAGAASEPIPAASA